MLGLPHETIIMQVEKLDGSIRVKRELEDGWFQQIEMPLPALLTIQSGINKLRYATLMGIKKASRKKSDESRWRSLGVVPRAAASKSHACTRRRRQNRPQIFEGAAQEAAAKLVENLKFEARVL